MTVLPASTERSLRRWARVTFVSAYLVVLAGSVVRMTGSGMGCPDWPRCFGLLIPPTESAQVTWTEGESYDTGRMLVANDTLWVVQQPLEAGSFAKAQAEGWVRPYDKHDYALFNPVHTWVEFINRLIGAFTGLPALVFFGLAVRHALRRRGWRPVLAAVWTLVMLAFAAWLGKKVVDGNLIPGSITLHMVGALAILAGLLVFIADSLRRERPMAWRLHRGWLAVATVLAAGQLVFGTQVREAIDGLSAAGVMRSDWLGALPDWWKAHRTASWVVLAAHAAWSVPLWRQGGDAKRLAQVVAAILAGQFLTGVAFSWAGMPAPAQPVHLLLGMALVLVNAWAWTRASRA